MSQEYGRECGRLERMAKPFCAGSECVFRLVDIDQIEQLEAAGRWKGRLPVAGRFRGASDPHPEQRIAVA